jgi:predicted nucleotidyltransferase
VELIGGIINLRLFGIQIRLKFFGMWSDLEELLGRKVDLVSEGTLLPFAKESAERDKILVYERTN